MTRRTLLCVAIAGGALALPASSQSATNGTPEAELYIDVATHSMPGMPQLGGLGRAAMGMFGGGNHYGMTRFPAMPGQYLDVALRNTLNPGGEAVDQVPAGLRLKQLPLLPPKAAPRGGDGVEGGIADGQVPDSTTRILVYWGCGTEVRPGQPKVIEITTKDGKVAVSGSLEGRYAPDRAVRTGPDTALWPNERDKRSVPEGASLAGEHVIRGERVPESLKFTLGETQDFMPKIQLAATGDLASGQTWRWQPVRGARGYFLHAMGARGKELVLWSSAETPDAGMGVVDYLANATVDKWIREKVLLAPSTTTCAMPGGIFAGSGGDAAGGMLRMIAYGSESHIAWPPRPADPKEPWDPEWNVRVRTKSTAMAMLGMDMRAAQDAREAQDQAPEEPAVKSLLKGLLRR